MGLSAASDSPSIPGQTEAGRNGKQANCVGFKCLPRLGVAPPALVSLFLNGSQSRPLPRLVACLEAQRILGGPTAPPSFLPLHPAARPPIAHLRMDLFSRCFLDLGKIPSLSQGRPEVLEVSALYPWLENWCMDTPAPSCQEDHLVVSLQ